MSFYIYKREDGIYILCNKKNNRVFVYDLSIKIENKKLILIYTTTSDNNKFLKDRQYIIQKEYEIKDRLSVYIKDFIYSLDKRLNKVDLLDRLLNKFLYKNTIKNN